MKAKGQKDNDTKLLYHFLFKQIFSGELSIGIPDCNEQEIFADSKVLITPFSLWPAYTTLIEALDYDVRNLYLNTILLWTREVCSEKNNFHNSDENCSFCPGYKKLCKFGKITKKYLYHVLTLYNDFSFFSILDDIEYKNNMPDIEVSDCTCKTYLHKFKTVKSGSKCIIYHMGADNDVSGYPVNSFFANYAEILIKAIPAFRGDKIDSLFFLFLQSHGIAHDKNDLFASPIELKAFKNDASISTRLC